MKHTGYLLGIDIGSSSVKATVLDAETQKVVAYAVSPEDEMEIISDEHGWAEQNPDVWWKNVMQTMLIIKNKFSIDLKDICAIGISYQMHGLVMVDNKLEPLTNAIIWCDSRAVHTGEKAFLELGQEKCFTHLLNSPANFTASKLAWIKENKPEIYKKIYKIMLPGDYIVAKMTSEPTTTILGLSEAILWDYKNKALADFLIDYFGFNHEIIPRIVPNFGICGFVSQNAAKELGLSYKTPVCYRAGDQPNNALALNVLNPQEIAATAGTSAVVYGVTDLPLYDSSLRLNTFAHVNYEIKNPSYGILLCINGAGILNRWLKQNVCTIDGCFLNYEQMNEEALLVPATSNGLMVFPYGNGAERTLDNINLSAFIYGLNFSLHSRKHLLRASQEGICFALKIGIDIMKNNGFIINVIRACNANLFKSKLFKSIFSSICGAPLEIYNTDGSAGAARGAGLGLKIYSTPAEAFSKLKLEEIIEPDKSLMQIYLDWFTKWKLILETVIINKENGLLIKQI
jgi:xylulokinase